MEKVFDYIQTATPQVLTSGLEEFWVGLASGVVMSIALMHLPIVRYALLLVAVLAFTAALSDGGVPALMHYVKAAIEHLKSHAEWLQGVVLGKSAVGLFTGWRWHRARKARA